MSIRERFNNYVDTHKTEPLYASVSLRWKDDGSEMDGEIVKLSSSYDETYDSFILFYCNDVSELEELATDKNTIADFYVIPESVEFIEQL